MSILSRITSFASLEDRHMWLIGERNVDKLVETNGKHKGGSASFVNSRCPKAGGKREKEKAA